MADNVTPTEIRRKRGLARVNRVCEACGGHYDQTPDGRMCGTGCRIPQVPVARGPYSKESWRAHLRVRGHDHVMLPGMKQRTDIPR